MIKSLYRFSTGVLGFDPRKLYFSLLGLPVFIKSYFIFKKQLKKFPEFRIEKLYPIINQHKEESGTAKGHYFHQDLLIANKIFINDPIKHVDVGSRIDGFVSHVASFRKIEVFDIRVLTAKIKNINFIQADFSNPNLKFSNYCDSLSCLHAIEHFGLGRYGDEIDVNGHIKGLDNLHKLLKQNGILYLSTPIGRQRVEFNAHRVFSMKYLLEYFENKYNVLNFSYVDELGDLHENVLLSEEGISKNFDCNYGCGIFELEKI